jgi:hypothetical protein
MDRRVWLIVAVVLLRLAALLFLLDRLPAVVDGHYVANDALRFHEIAVTPGTPYVDFEVEVPPAEYFYLVAQHGTDPRSTAVNLAIGQFLLDLVLVGGLLCGWNQRAAIAYLLISLPLIPYLYFRVDLLSMTLAVLGFAFVRKRLNVLGGITLALAVMSKVWPLALLPLLLVERRWKATAVFVGATAAAFAGWIAWVGLDGIREVATFRSSHGWQIESVVGTIVLLVSAKPVVYEGGALRVGEAAAAARAALTGTFAFAAGVASVLAWKRDAVRGSGRDTVRLDEGPDGTAVLAVVIVAAMLVLSPILSWQYVAWLIPWAAIAAADGDYPLGGLTLVVTALTSWLVFLSLPLSARSHLAEAVALIRDSVLVVIVVLGFFRLIRGRRSTEDWQTGIRDPEPVDI